MTTTAGDGPHVPAETAERAAAAFWAHAHGLVNAAFAFAHLDHALAECRRDQR